MNLPPEPPPGSSITDATGHVFVRRADGEWACRDHEDLIEFDWETVALDSVKPWQVTLSVPWSGVPGILAWVREVKAYSKEQP